MKVTVLHTMFGLWVEIEWQGYAGAGDSFTGALNGLLLALQIEHIEVGGV